MNLRRTVTVLVGMFLALAAVGISTAAASAATSTLAPPGFYQVFGTDGTLAVQSKPSVGHVIGSVPEGALVDVICQVNNGSTADGLPSHTWDKIGNNAWVYDWYIATPPEDAAGWSLNTGCNGEIPR